MCTGLQLLAGALLRNGKRSCFKAMASYGFLTPADSAFELQPVFNPDARRSSLVFAARENRGFPFFVFRLVDLTFGITLIQDPQR